MADSKTIDDGGPAFSGGLYEPPHSGSNDLEPMNPGMSLRDWYAGHALAGMGTWAPVEPAEWIHRDMVQRMRAEWAFEQADAMIAARKAGG